MAGSDLKEVFDFFKLFVVNFALCLFLVIGVLKLLFEELMSLISVYKKVKKLLK